MEIILTYFLLYLIEFLLIFVALNIILQSIKLIRGKKQWE